MEQTTFIHRFLAQAEKTPDRVAVSDAAGEWLCAGLPQGSEASEGLPQNGIPGTDCSTKAYSHGDLSYEDLKHRSGVLAAELRSRGVKEGEPVAVLLPRTKDIVVAAIGAMRCGGVYMPLDAAYPEERLRYMMGDSGARILITTRELLAEKFGCTDAPEAIFIDSTPLNCTTCTKQEEVAEPEEEHKQEGQWQEACTKQEEVAELEADKKEEEQKQKANTQQAAELEACTKQEEVTEPEEEHKQEGQWQKANTKQVAETEAGTKEEEQKQEANAKQETVREACEEYDAPLTPESYAFLLYTSGTTGRPKGVLHTHRSLLAMVTQEYGCDFDATGIVAGFTFIASAFMMFPPLIQGGKCDIVPEDAKSDMASLHEYVTRKGIRELFLPASLAASLSEEYELDGVTIFSAGEKLRTFKAKGACRVINVYGSTEGVSVLAWTVRGDEADIPLGNPLPGVTVRIVEVIEPATPPAATTNGTEKEAADGTGEEAADGTEKEAADGTGKEATEGTGKEATIGTGKEAADGGGEAAEGSIFRDVAPGEAGELIYTGDIMAGCYLHLEEQTKAKWIEEGGVRWYRTSDRMRVDGEGHYHYLGRSDNMVKIRGFRVETGEVENCIREACPLIRDAVVVLRCLHGIDHLCCYYTVSALNQTKEDTGQEKAKSQTKEGSGQEAALNQTKTVPGQEINVEAVKKSIAGKLAEYMIPDIWTELDEMPKNANGKIMRSALPEPRQEIEALSAIYSEVEMRVEEAARTVLGLDTPVGLDESFLDAGGDSIRAMKLSAILAEQGIKISGAEILRIKVLRKIAEEARVAYERLWTPDQWTAVQERFAARGEKILKVLPLSPEQDDRVYSALFFPDGSEGRSVFVLPIDSTPGEDELSTAVEKAAGEYENLRAALVYEGVSAFQQVITDRKVPVSSIDLSGKDNPMAETALLYERLKTAPFDLEASPAMEVVHAKHPDGGCLLFKVLEAALPVELAREGIAFILNYLLKAHPDDGQMAEWADLLEMASESEGVSGQKTARAKAPEVKERYEEITVYSSHPGKKDVVFVHTGNSGGDVYYALADKIGGECSFSVIEPFNLYNPHCAIDGIKGIAAKYIEILRRHQPRGPYFLGGWCYGGVVAHEMACQLQEQGETVERLVMLDSHAVADPESRRLFKTMASGTKDEYYETSPLFADLRSQGLLGSVIANSKRVARNLAEHYPSVFNGPVLYFKPQVTPAGLGGESLQYWQEMMKHRAGGYESFCTDLSIIPTPHEHDLMMDAESLRTIVPELMKLLDE